MVTQRIRFPKEELSAEELPYSSGDVERYTGVPQTIVRDWRRRGLLSLQGEEQGGRWRYSLDDLFSFAVISQLTKTSVLDLQGAWDISGLVTDMLIERIRGVNGELSGRYFFTWPRESIADDIPLGAVEDDDLGRAMSYSPAAIALCIDLDRLIDSLPGTLIGLVRKKDET